MDTRTLIAFIRAQPWAVQASVSPDGAPQAAVIGVVVSDSLELFFDTSAASRKCRNLRREPRLALVIGWDQGQTVQLEGRADEPTGADLMRLQELYFTRFPDGRARANWPDIAYVRVRPTWIRYSDFRQDPPLIVQVAS
jgi:pyridoxine/pyridoxamine 5'-phosphate oxidase